MWDKRINYILKTHCMSQNRKAQWILVSPDNSNRNGHDVSKFSEHILRVKYSDIQKKENWHVCYWFTINNAQWH